MESRKLRNRTKKKINLKREKQNTETKEEKDNKFNEKKQEK